jgi:hypothetical protein
MKLALNGVMHILTDLLVGNVNAGFKANQTELKKTTQNVSIYFKPSYLCCSKL